MKFILFIKDYQAVILATVFAVIFVSEHLVPQRKIHRVLKHDLINFFFGAINVSISFSAGFYFSKYLNWAETKKFGLLFQFTINPFLKLIIVLIIADVLMYWWHRFNHVIPFLWRFHSFHHKDEQMNSTTGIRFHSIELLLSFIFRMFFYPLIGITGFEVVIFSTIHFSMILFHHSNISITDKIDKLVRIFITSPGMHRIHHSNKLEETNSNYTSILSCWDWVFGSYVKKPKEEIIFGISESGVRLE